MHFMQFFLEIEMKIEALSFKNIGPEGNLIEKENLIHFWQSYYNLTWGCVVYVKVGFSSNKGA